jgi:hypothetical protein
MPVPQRTVLVEIGLEGWTPTQQPPFLSHSLLDTAKGTTATSAKKEDAETKQHKENTREHLADRRPKELRMHSVLSSLLITVCPFHYKGLTI